MKPRARETGLLVRELGHEIVVYDLVRHEAHCLNPSAAAVFRRCDGRRTVSVLARELRGELGAEVDEQWVALALEGLAGARLLVADPSPAPPPGAGRRDVLRQAGLGAALLLPAVVSMIAPTPAEAANTCIPVTSCTTSNIGQPCYNSNPAVECTLNECKGNNSCGPI